MRSGSSIARGALAGLLVILAFSLVEACVPFLGDQHTFAISDSNHDPAVEIITDAS
jgi:hypothetical protein